MNQLVWGKENMEYNPLKKKKLPKKNKLKRSQVPKITSGVLPIYPYVHCSLSLSRLLAVPLAQKPSQMGE